MKIKLPIRNKLLAVSLFSGAMGLDIGIRKSGIETVCCVEINKHACNTIRSNTNIPVIEGDIHNITAKDIEQASGVSSDKISLVYGGPPCQAFSTAGKQRSLQDFRGNLVLQFLRVVSEIKPEYFIFENVRGILYAKLNAVPSSYSEYQSVVKLSGSVVYMLMSEFQKLGYSVSFSLFDSSRYGVPQSRERFIMFGTLSKNAVPIPAPTHTKDNNLFPKLKPLLTLEEALRGLIDNDKLGVQLSKKQQKFLILLKSGQCWTSLPKKLQEEALGGAYRLTGGRTGFYRRLAWDKPCPTLVTVPTMPATMLCHPVELRPLTIREYARIQQFPDYWEFKGPLLEVYKQIGNAVPINLGKVAGQAIIRHSKLKHKPLEIKILKTTRYLNTNNIEFLNEFYKKMGKTIKL